MIAYRNFKVHDFILKKQFLKKCTCSINKWFKILKEESFGDHTHTHNAGNVRIKATVKDPKYIRFHQMQEFSSSSDNGKQRKDTQPRVDSEEEAVFEFAAKPEIEEDIDIFVLTGLT